MASGLYLLGLASMAIDLKDLDNVASRLMDFIGMRSERKTRSQSKPIQQPTQQDAPSKSYLFRKDGDYWAVAFEGKQSTVKHSKGMEYLARLLANPFKDISVFDFMPFESVRPGVRPHKGISESELEQEGLSISGFGDAGPILDDEAKKQYKDRLYIIEVELKRADDDNDPGRMKGSKRERSTPG